MDRSSPLSHDTDSALQRHLMMVLSHSDEGMVSMTADWRVTSVNAVASRLLSTSQHHLVGHFLWQRHPELVGTGLFQQCHQAQLSQKSTPLEALLLPTGVWIAGYITVAPTGTVISFHETTLPSHSAVLHTRLMELASDAIVVRDPQSRIVSWNRGAEQLYGFSAQEAIGKISHDLLHTRFPLSKQALDRFLASGEIWEGELTHTHKDGAVILVESRQVLIRTDGGEPVAIMEINRDITQQRTRERENQEQYRTIVQTANEGIWLVDRDARTLFINERMAQMLGYRGEEMVGHQVSEFVFPQDIPLAQARIGRNFQGQFEQFDFRFRHKQGNAVDVLVCSSPVRDGQGHITGALGMFTDVTERKQVQEAHQRLAALVESADLPMIGKTRQGIITSWNKAAEHMYGYSAAEVVGQPITILFPADRQDEFVRIMEQISRGEQVDLYETVRCRKDGKELWVSITVSPIYDREGHIVGASDIAHDISEQRRIRLHEQFLTEVSLVLASSLDYQQTLSNVARLIVPELADWFAVDLVDEEGRFELVELAHKDPEQVQWARTLREENPIDPAAPTGLPHVVRTGRAQLYREIPDALLVARATTEEELERARQIGYSSVMLVPLVARGKPIGVVSFVATESGKQYDERDLALAEEVGRRAGVALDNARLYREVREAHDQLEIILQGVADGIIVYGPQSQILYANEAAARMTNSGSAQQMRTTGQLEIVERYEILDEQEQPFPRNQLTHLRVLAGEPYAEVVMGYREKESTQPQHWSLVKSSPVLDAHGEVALVVTIFHDITERMHLEQRKDEFISMTSHELKTPVTSLKGFTHVLMRRLTKQGDKEGLSYLARMDAQLNKLTRLISELLDLSRMQSGKLLMRPEPLELDMLLTETVENVQATTSTHTLLIEGNTEALVLGDRDRLGQVFINLLTNAIKYSPHAQQVLLHCSRSAEGQEALVGVQDFGIGIAQAHHEQIFERFYQVTDPEEKTYPGLGIGLYISREIVMRHHGRMWLESCKGKGSTFWVALPVLQKNAMPRGERAQAHDAALS